MTDTAPILAFPEGDDNPLGKIHALQRASAELPQVDLPLKHWFPAGLYVRQIFMPAGATIVSRVHKFEHLTVVLAGRAVVYGEDGSSKDIAAPMVFVTQPGTKRALHILEDSIWLTVHATTLRTVEECESELVADSETVEDYARLLATIQGQQFIEVTT